MSVRTSKLGACFRTRREVRDTRHDLILKIRLRNQVREPTPVVRSSFGLVFADPTTAYLHTYV